MVLSSKAHLLATIGGRGEQHQKAWAWREQELPGVCWAVVDIVTRPTKGEAIGMWQYLLLTRKDEQKVSSINNLLHQHPWLNEKLPVEDTAPLQFKHALHNRQG